MPRRLAAYIAGLAAVSAVALAATSLVVPIDPRVRLGLFADPVVDSLAGVLFWILVTLVASALPVRMLRGSLVTTSIAPLVVVMYLGGPTAAAWVGLIGTLEMRELRGRISCTDAREPLRFCCPQSRAVSLLPRS